MTADLTPFFDEKWILHEEEGRRISQTPYWPGGKSGVTLPGGWDCSQQDRDALEQDWGRYLVPGDIRRLAACLGKNVVGGQAQTMAASNVIRTIVIKPDWAIEVFEKRTLPRYYAIAKATFPGMVQHGKAVQTAVTSLVYNRGGIPQHTIPIDSSSTDVDRYSAERMIRFHLAEPDLVDVCRSWQSMEIKDGPDALWPGNAPPNPGLRLRRGREWRLIATEIPGGMPA